MFKKNQIKFENNFDFNSISNLLSNGNFVSRIKSRWGESYILESIFQIKNINQSNKSLEEMYNNLNKLYNVKKANSDLDLFFSLIPGTRCNTHSDKYDVYIVGAYGRTLYKVENKEYIVSSGDVLHIPPYNTHTSISLDPRIIISFAVYNV
jgi:ribosomal protein L16 Arg81 hydroxylase